MRIALVHDDLVQWGGAERMLLGLSEIFPQAPIYTSVFDISNQQLTEHFKDKIVVTSFLQKIPGFKKLYKALFPLYSVAFEQFDFSGFDVVVSQSTRFAKNIITKPNTKHICYCHTPPRFLWNQNNPFFSYFRIFDRIASCRVDHFIAGSKNAQSRIKKIYKSDCPVVYPFVDIKRFANLKSFDGGYFVVITRLNKYKRVDIAIEAASKLNIPLKVIGTGPELNVLKGLTVRLKGKVDFLGQLTDNLVNEVLAGAKALIICAKEDFGITALEAQALGKPVVAYGEGGVLETVIEGKTGYYFGNQNSESLIVVLKNIDLNKIDPEVCKMNAGRFSKEKFISNFKYVL